MPVARWDDRLDDLSQRATFVKGLAIYLTMSILLMLVPPRTRRQHMAKQEWMREALCKDLSAKEADRLFFIGPGQKSKRAKLFCTSCPVKSQCSQFAIAYDEIGVWAGNTEDERKILDPFVKDSLRTLAASRGMLESRNLNDFLSQQVRPLTLPQEEDLIERLLQEAQLMVQDLLFEPTTFLQVNDL